jgi:hypothetical protein
MVGTGSGSDLPTEGSGCVAGNAGGFVRCGTGSRSEGTSTLPLWTKTLAWGLATMTRAGAPRRPDAVDNSAAGFGAGGSGAALAAGGSGGVALVKPKVGTCCEAGFCGKRGVVFALDGAPVTGGAEGFGGTGGGMTAGGVFEMLGIGLVTAVDQAGGTLITGAGSNCPEVLIGKVVAAETFGRGAGVIFAVAGLRGRGGKLMRSVSRLGALGSDPSGLAESAIFFLFIVISENVQWRNSQS